MGDGTEEKIQLFGIVCPLGSQCKKGGSNLCKKETEEAARAFLVNHLKASSYHELTQQEAEETAMAAEVTSWEEEVSSYRKDAEAARDWVAARRRAAGRGGGAASSARCAPYMPPLPNILGGDGDGCGMLPDGSAPNRIQMVPLRPDRVLMTKEECKNISDSLRRAHAACQAAQQLCGKASRAFAEEAAAISQCKEVVDSHLPEYSGAGPSVGPWAPR